MMNAKLDKAGGLWLYKEQKWVEQFCYHDSGVCGLRCPLLTITLLDDDNRLLTVECGNSRGVHLLEKER